MRPTPQQQWLKIAWRAVAAGERELMKRFHLATTTKLKFKAHHEIVTAADLAANSAIQRVLTKLTPGIPVLSEEGGSIQTSPALKADLAWVLDPLDGTTNYTIRLPLWGISLALVRDGEPILGVISLPALHKHFHATVGGGAWLGRDRLHVSKTKQLIETTGLLCYGYSNDDKRRGMNANRFLSMASRTTRRLGSAVVEAAWIAMGHADYAVLHGAKPWDVAAGALLVREAGGDVVTPKGKQWSLGKSDMVFSSPGVTKSVLK